MTGLFYTERLKQLIDTESKESGKTIKEIS